MGPVREIWVLLGKYGGAIFYIVEPHFTSWNHRDPYLPSGIILTIWTHIFHLDLAGAIFPSMNHINILYPHFTCQTYQNPHFPCKIHINILEPIFIMFTNIYHLKSIFIKMEPHFPLGPIRIHISHGRAIFNTKDHYLIFGLSVSHLDPYSPPGPTKSGIF